MFYHQATNTYITEGQAFSLGEVQYPSNWLNLASPEDKAALGLQEVVTVGTREDDRYFWVDETLKGSTRTIINKPKDQKMVMELRVKEYTAALEAFYDQKAQERQYDNRYTCSLRAGFPGPFQAEGLAFAQWMDACNASAYQIMAAVQGGTRPMPTVEQVISELPTMEWPA